MSSAEKDEAINKFRDNETQILVSTTVVEVGVDDDGSGHRNHPLLDRWIERRAEGGHHLREDIVAPLHSGGEPGGVNG